MLATSANRVLRRVAVVLGISRADRALLNILQPLLDKETETNLQGVFIEDNELQQVANLPFVKELCRLTLSVREIHSTQFERTVAVRTRSARRAITSLALSTGLPHSFQTVKGSTVNLLRETAHSADITIFEPLRIFAAPAIALPAPAPRSLQRIVVAVNDFSMGAETLAAANFLAGGKMRRLHLLLTATTSAELDALNRMIEEHFPDDPARIQLIPGAEIQKLIATANSERADMLVLGASEDLLKPESLQTLLKQLRCPICLVRRWPGTGAG